MNIEVLFGIVLAVVGGGILWYFFKHIGDRPTEPENYIQFVTINGKRVAYLHMAEPPNSNDYLQIGNAFSEAMHLLYNDPTVDSDDFQLAWDGYMDFRRAVKIEHG